MVCDPYGGALKPKDNPLVVVAAGAGFSVNVEAGVDAGVVRPNVGAGCTDAVCCVVGAPNEKLVVALV